MTFALRDYDPAADGDFVVWSWLDSYARSEYGKACGASVAQTMPGYHARPAQGAWSRYWDAHHPIVTSLLAESDVVIACDADAPEVIWGWACTSGDTVHYVMAKRSVHQASATRDASGHGWRVTTGLSGEMYRALLGDRLKRRCGYTHELVDFRRRELRAQGIELPREWYADTTWFERRRRAA